MVVIVLFGSSAMSGAGVGLEVGTGMMAALGGWKRGGVDGFEVAGVVEVESDVLDCVTGVGVVAGVESFVWRLVVDAEGVIGSGCEDCICGADEGADMCDVSFFSSSWHPGARSGGCNCDARGCCRGDCCDAASFAGVELSSRTPPSFGFGVAPVGADAADELPGLDLTAPLPILSILSRHFLSAIRKADGLEPSLDSIP